MHTLTVVVTRFLFLGSLLLALPAITAAQTTLQSPLPHEDRYAPIQLGIPAIIGGYRVLAVLTENNFVCMRPEEKRLVLQSPELTIEDGPRDFPKELIEQELQARNLTESAQWESNIVGPGVTREQLISELEQSYRFYKEHDCPTRKLPPTTSPVLDLPGKCPLIPGSELTGGEYRCPGAGVGFAIIQNLDADKLWSNKYPNTGQGVILIAPSFRNSQNPWCEFSVGGRCAKYHTAYSAFLNNGMTDKHYFLQVGLYFTNWPSRDLSRRGVKPIVKDCVGLPDPDRGNPGLPDGMGWVVFVGAKIEEGKKADLRPRALCVPYVAGHHYYTTIAYTSGVWWTCAADIENSSTYRCQPHGGKELGSHLIKHLSGTNVFAENGNKNGTNAHPPKWMAYGARTHSEDGGHPWSSEAKVTQHNCDNKSWPVAEAIVQGFTERDGTAVFSTDDLPRYCE